MALRILVTGSRDWNSGYTIAMSLSAIAVEFDDAEITLVSGACPRGADRLAENCARGWGWTVERHPADWDTHGKRAGYLRNKAMVDAGADVCLAYIRDYSRGATMTAEMARAAGIRLHVYREGP